ncbi:hypothetical protein CYLTODRAFT_389313 [Cylindrobasidium torrendii FP15055 ss-10]|uniref:GST C-terminal domain-containing protein n=1 Tax=Cylindrobasidium torrendii FP15055 ss-10 TaxID=1314674 RepID=A0A0D7BPI1_9AGAR|nr:hypothetical protein CYLTODRAFT_389313 [Cylindrobasidium torrendii FP15055 ss-10]
MGDTGNYVLHVWPGKWNLASFDPLCLASVLYLQYTLRGKYSIVECVSADSSPAGVLPVLFHNSKTICPLSALLKYHPSSNELDAFLSPSERAKATAMAAHAESSLGDLVAHIQFAQEANWRELVNPSLAASYSFPQHFYAPSRLRASFRSRLEAAELWVTEGEEVEKDTHESSFKASLPHKPTLPDLKAKRHDRFLRVFEREKVMEKARSTLEIYARLLGSNQFFFGDSRVSSLDFVVAAHVLLIIQPPYPDRLIKDNLLKSFPQLRDHAEMIHHICFPETTSLPPTTQQSFSFLSLFPWIL